MRVLRCATSTRATDSGGRQWQAMKQQRRSSRRRTPRPDAGRRRPADRRARVLRDPDRRRRRAGRRQPGAGHLLLRHQGQPAHRGAALVGACPSTRRSRRCCATTPALRDRLENLVAWTCLPDEQARPAGDWGLWFDLWAQAFRHPEVKKDRVAARPAVARPDRAGRPGRASTPARSARSTSRRSPSCGPPCSTAWSCRSPSTTPSSTALRPADGPRDVALKELGLA